MTRTSTGARACLLGLVLGLGGLVPATAAPQISSQELLAEVGVDQRLGESLPLDAKFFASDGSEVRLGDYFGERPVVVAYVYYECPMLCGLILNGLLRCLRAMDFTAGEDFDVVCIGIDPDETPELARANEDKLVEEYGREEDGREKDGREADRRGWHLLTGSPESIERATRAGGFRYVYEEESDEFAHASAILVATPEGVLSHYFYGVEYSTKDVRRALVEAGDGRVGSLVDQFLMFCYHYDPTTGKYGVAIMRMVRTGGILTVVGMASLVAFFLRKERRVSLGAPAGTGRAA